MKSSLTFIGFAFAVVTLLFFLSSQKTVPSIPRDYFHEGTVNHFACQTCHTPGRQAPLEEDHPPDEECFSCHLHKA